MIFILPNVLSSALISKRAELHGNIFCDYVQVLRHYSGATLEHDAPYLYLDTCETLVSFLSPIDTFR
jgi:hypothetical protein